MKKADFQKLVELASSNYPTEGADVSVLDGCALPDFPKRKVVTVPTAVDFLRWQALQLNGQWDQEELTECLTIFTKKQIVLV